jgi:hypothetical protein
LLIEPFKDDEHYRDFVTGKSDEELNKYFAAVEVHLSRPDQVDYVIEGRDPFVGADSARLWIVRSSGPHPKVVLNENASFFELLNSRTSGYRDIRSVWIMSGHRRTRVFHFNGTEYKRIEEKWSEDLH